MFSTFSSKLYEIIGSSLFFDSNAISQADPSFKGALFNLALLLTNSLQRPSDAIPYLNRNIQLYPDHVKSYLLLGDISINHEKDLQLAEQVTFWCIFNISSLSCHF